MSSARMTDERPPADTADEHLDDAQEHATPPHPSPAEGGGPSAERPPRPSQAEGERDDAEDADR